MNLKKWNSMDLNHDKKNFDAYIMNKWIEGLSSRIEEWDLISETRLAMQKDTCTCACYLEDNTERGCRTQKNLSVLSFCKKYMCNSNSQILSSLVLLMYNDRIYAFFFAEYYFLCK